MLNNFLFYIVITRFSLVISLFFVIITKNIVFSLINLYICRLFSIILILLFKFEFEYNLFLIIIIITINFLSILFHFSLIKYNWSNFAINWSDSLSYIFMIILVSLVIQTKNFFNFIKNREYFKLSSDIIIFYCPCTKEIRTSHRT